LYSFSSLLVFVYFIKYQRKYLHSLEIFFYWCAASLLIQNLSAIETMNIKNAVIPDAITYELSHVLIRIVLYPIVTLFYLNKIAAAASWMKQTWPVIAYSALLLALEWISDWLGVFRHMKPYLVWSGVFWVAYLMIMMGIMKLFRRTFYRGYLQR
jgi:hypothetical protein